MVIEKEDAQVFNKERKRVIAASAEAISFPSLPDLIRQSMRRFSMDHRVKPGGDEGKFYRGAG
jgi:hypothetical protein